MGLTRIKAEQISDIDYKQAVRVVTTSNVTLTGGAPATVDGVSLMANDRVLVNGQSSGAENGLYKVQTLGTGSNGTWVRSDDGNQSGEIEAGMVIMVTEGTVYADTQWKLTTNNPIIIGTTPLTFVINILSSVGGANTQVQFNDGGTLSATSGFTFDKASNLVTVSGNVSAANVVTTGQVTATGNVTGGNFTTTGDVTAGGLTLSGNTISSASATMTIDPSAPGVTGTVIVAGNLSVQGTTTTYDSTTVTINDLVFSVANNAATASAANGGGIEVGPAGSPYATWLYDQPNSRWSTALGIVATGNITGGNLSGTSVTGTLTTAAQPNITSVGTLTSLSVTGNVSGGNLLLTGSVIDSGDLTLTSSATNGNVTLTPTGTGTIVVNKNITNGQANGVGNIGSSTTYFNTVFAKATSAQYADLAELYQADQDYEPGTVVIFGGEHEITTTSISHDTRVAGVISTDPAFVMNTCSGGIPVALTGRVPCRVLGPVSKGDVLVTSSMPGVAQRLGSDYQPGCILGKSLDLIATATVETIEVVVGRF